MSAPLFPIVIRLAGEPRGKGRPRLMRATGHAYTPKRTRDYEAALRMAGQNAMGLRAPVEGSLKVTMTAGMGIPASWSKKKRAAALAGEVQPTSRPDVDNLAKTLDALNEVVFRDDSQITVLTVMKTYAERPQMLIVVRPADADLAA